MVTEVIVFFAVFGVALILSARELRVKQLRYPKKQHHPEKTSWEEFSERWAKAYNKPDAHDTAINAIAITTSYWQSIQTSRKSQKLSEPLHAR